VRNRGPVILPRHVRRHPCTILEQAHRLAKAVLYSIVTIALTAQAQAPFSAKQNQKTSAPEYASFSSPSVLAEPPGLLYAGVPPKISQDEGLPGLRFQLLRLGTTARLMQVVAHPDDEDGGMLTLEARGHGVNTLLMTLNRGEGGQNKIGSNLSDVLGVVRSLELLASDQYYGVQERFSRVADFGFSKSADETFQKWGGHDIALGDMVRVIRTFHPDVLIARFSGTPRDGHGNHQASSILTREAFRAAADPKRFPEQIEEGLEPWQAKKLYIGNVCPWGAKTCPDADWTVKLNTGQVNDQLGMSYIQFALQGLRHQLSQGAANWSVEPGDRFTFYKLVDSVLPSALDKNGHEKDFFEGIDTSLPALAAHLGSEEKKVPQLRQQLAGITKLVTEASQAAKSGDASAPATPLAAILAGLRQAADEVRGSSLDPAAKYDLLIRLAAKRQQAETALNLALGVNLSADVSSGSSSSSLPKEADALTAVSPGQEFMVAVTFHNGSRQPVAVDSIKLEVPAGWNTVSGRTKPQTVKPGEDLHADFRLRVPRDASYTKPYWHRDNPNTDSLNHIDNEKYATLPFPPPPLRAHVEYSAPTAGKATARNGINAVVVTPFLDNAGQGRSRPLAIVPAFSVELEPGTLVISTHNGSISSVTVAVTSNHSPPVQGKLRLELPEGWRSEPAESRVNFSHRGEKKEFQFKIVPARLQQGKPTIHAVLESEGEKYIEGYTLITREDLGSFYYYQPAQQRVSIVDVKVPHDLRVGYIMGAGDEIPTVLKQIGMNVTLIPAEKLATENLSQYDTIVLGIRAYDTQKDVVANNNRLLDFVHAGGTLVVQYNTGVQDFNSEKLTPYPAQLSRERVSVEEAPVQILAPDDPIFHDPNTIAERDFEGWIQERGLYFMSNWDDHFTPLLACHDPGEDPQEGGLLRAQYGKGTYIYTGYSFFRELPAGVPGAVRLYVNILSAGHP
jgi:LmbE family N-acetylglucosaminyl deacetylase